jgi:hypothetical protein
VTLQTVGLTSSSGGSQLADNEGRHLSKDSGIDMSADRSHTRPNEARLAPRRGRRVVVDGIEERGRGAGKNTRRRIAAGWLR